MTKEVLLAIRGLQIAEDEQKDTVETISPGEYYFRNGKHFFLYEDVEEGQAKVTKNIIKVSKDYMELTKKGIVNVHMVFEKNKKVKVTVSKSGKGKVKGAGKYYVGTNVKIKVKAAKGYVIKSIKAGKKIAVKKKATKKNFTIKKIKKATKVKVVFAKK